MWLREAKWFDRPMALAMVWNMKCLSPARSSASTQRPSPQWRSWSRRSASQRSMNPWLSKLCCLFAEQVGGEGSIFVAGHPVRFGDEGQHCTHGDSTVQVGLELQEGGPQASSCRHFFLWQVCAVFLFQSNYPTIESSHRYQHRLNSCINQSCGTPYKSNIFSGFGCYCFQD